MREYIVLDLETLHSADDCRYCGASHDQHIHTLCPYIPLGWSDKAALGLSVGCYWSSATQQITWFDAASLNVTITTLVQTQPLLVSFNGKSFDSPLMLALYRQQERNSTYIYETCTQFRLLANHSYDILREIWRADPLSKRIAGVNSLDAISQANGLDCKRGTGTQAPQDWREGRRADVLNYCQDDVLKTLTLFHKVLSGTLIQRTERYSLTLPVPSTVCTPHVQRYTAIV